MRFLLRCLTVLAIDLAARGALAGDPAAAREQLKQGFALKEAGRCEEAIPHFVESQRLDPQPKALINLAECQDKTRQLVEAEQNLVAARDMATRPEQSTLRDIAVRRLAALEPRLPRLTVTLAPGGAADGVEVLRDGTTLGRVSLGTPLPTNPGKHVVVVRAAGRRERSFEVTLAEGEQQALAVAPGDALPLADGSPAQGETSPGASIEAGGAPNVGAPSPAPGLGGRRTIALVVGGAGAVALAVGGAFAIASIVEYGQSNGGCNASNQCMADALTSRQHSLQHGDFATGFLGAGAALAAAGAVLWLTAPASPSSTTARIGVTPTADGAGLQLGGAW